MVLLTEGGNPGGGPDFPKKSVFLRFLMSIMHSFDYGIARFEFFVKNPAD